MGNKTRIIYIILIMKTYVLIVSQRFPMTHPRKGQPTMFIENILNKTKIHTIRGNFPLWEKRIEEVQNELAVISDNHFKERLQVDQYKIFEEDECVVCQVHWVDKRNKYFEIAWSKEYNESNPNCSDITMSLGAVGSVFNTDKIFDLLHENHYDTKRLIERGLAKQKP